jgi:[histone H4]-N-methyl-L-lysine20 N-methyltransferase
MHAKSLLDSLPPIRYYLKSYTQKQINAFATCVLYLFFLFLSPYLLFASHASRYFELYNPSGYIEIAHTSRYSHRTGKSELCILATRNLVPGTVITELKGSMANLTEEEDKELKKTDIRNSDVRRDFSVIHSKQMKKNHLFLGPARFVNVSKLPKNFFFEFPDVSHDSTIVTITVNSFARENILLLEFSGLSLLEKRLPRTMVMATVSPSLNFLTVADLPFQVGRKNRFCLCETCEKRGRGGYDPQNVEDEVQVNSDSDSESDASSSDSDSEIDETEPKSNLNVDERRTRRGVYAVLQKKEDESDESDDEDGNNIPLAGALDIPADGEIELMTEIDITSELTSLTPSESAHEDQSSHAHPTPAPNSRLPSCSSSLTSLSLANDHPFTPKRSDSSSFRSIISTRRQKARASQTNSPTVNPQLVTPPLSEDAEVSCTPTKRALRSSSSVRMSVGLSADKRKGKEKVSTPLPTPSQGRAAKDDIAVKKEETEPRTLRARPSALNVVEVSKEPPAREIPRGPDGKPLPTCSTCWNVLPVISVDSKVVWGLGLESSPRKKKKKQDCPRYVSYLLLLLFLSWNFLNRCIRHFAIYGQPWPGRVPPHGAGFLPTPREDPTPVESSTKRVTHKALPALDRKLAAAASGSTKTRKHDDDSSDRPAKRRKTESSSVAEVFPKAKKATQPNDGKSDKITAEVPEQPVKRKRGRPRLTSPRAMKVRVKVEEKSSHLQGESTMGQPRNSNGTFGEKSSPDLQRNGLSRAERALERERVKKLNDGETDEISGKWTSPRRKRGNDGDGEGDGLTELSPRKRRYWRRSEFKKVLPHPITSFRGGKLFSNPNPLSFALQAWGGTVILDESSSDDEKSPVTPDDVQSPPASIVEVESNPDPDLSISSLLIPASALPRSALSFKPSPFDFAKRRWMSVSAGNVGAPDDPQQEDENSSSSVSDRSSATDIEKTSNNQYSIPSHAGLPWEIDMYSSDEEVRVTFFESCCLPYPSSPL